MRRSSVVDFLGIVRVVGYAIALVAAMAAGVFWLAGIWLPAIRMIVAPGFALWILSGLLIAWTAGLSRILVRRMRFQSPQE
jgi:hypothetical protein